MRTARKALQTCLGTGLLLWLSAAQAQTISVSPDQGTAGTQVTITGARFGTVRGTVSIGAKRTEVVTWDLDKVVCKVLPMPPGSYTLAVRYGGAGLTGPALTASFTVKPPRVLSPIYRPQYLTAGQPVTVKGEFFGERQGTVWLESQLGIVRLCAVQSWSGASITFVAPEGLTGLCHLKVENEVAICDESHWGTFVKPPSPPPVVGDDYTGPQTHTSAAGIYIGGPVYVFYSTEDGSGDDIHYRIRNEDGSWSDTGGSVENSTSKGQSKAVVTPVLVNDTLYVFFTGLDGKLDYYYLDPTTNGWVGINHVDGADATYPDARFAAVYNFTKGRIEVYYMKANTWELYFLYLDLATGTWSTKQLVASQTGMNPSFSGVFYQTGDGTYVTYLSWSAYNLAHVYHLVDGTVSKTDDNASWQVQTSQYDAPSLADFGEDRMALLWCTKKGSTDNSYSYYYQIFDKTTQAWTGSPICVVDKMGNGWPPTGAVRYVKTKDSTSNDGYRWDASSFLLSGSKAFADDYWMCIDIGTEGYWTLVDVESETRFMNYADDTFASWPLLQVVDLPPFLINGSTTDPTFTCTSPTNCTRTEFAVSSTTKDILEGTIQRGAYFGYEGGKRSPLTFSFGIGASAGSGTATSLSLKQVDSLVRNIDGKVMALYMAPQLTTYKYEWHNYDKGATGIYSYPVGMTGADILSRTFNPDEGPQCTNAPCAGVTQPYMDTSLFTIHKASTDVERLKTYATAPDPGYSSISASGSWNSSQTATVGWDGSTTTTRTASGKFTFKIGVSVAQECKIGGGIEGSFEVKYSTSMMKGAASTTYLINPDAKVKGDVASFDVLAYWLDGVADSYWVPIHRTGLGDKPFFITYRVTSYAVQQ